MRAMVDPERCEGNAICVNLVPEVFQLVEDDRTQVVLPEVPPHLANQVRQAVWCCPKIALRVEED
jgi:ferredoxin